MYVYMHMQMYVYVCTSDSTVVYYIIMCNRTLTIYIYKAYALMYINCPACINPIIAHVVLKYDNMFL